jgi:hypothetical protein
MISSKSVACDGHASLCQRHGSRLGSDTPSPHYGFSQPTTLRFVEPVAFHAPDGSNPEIR